MSRNIAIPAALLAALVFAAPAAARSFTVTTAGNSPDVAVDGGGTAHVVWDTRDATGTSITHYCKVLRTGKACAAGSERTFAPLPGDRDFSGPKVFLPGGGRVIVVTNRCCSSDQAPGPDGAYHGSHTFRFVSPDGGTTFDAGAWIGDQQADIGAALLPGDIFLALGITGGGTGVQGSPLAGFGGVKNTITPLLGLSGGVGVGANGTVLAINDRNSVYTAKLTGDPNAPGTWPLTKLGSGSDTRVTSGPKGPDVFYRVGKNDMRYVVRRLSSKGTWGKQITVSETGYPIFGNVAQDPKGRIHAVWRGLHGLTYRVSSTNGRDFRKRRIVSDARSGRWFNLVVSADAKGRAAIVYDSNSDAGKVAGYTVG